ncbi:MAG TPA: hypothetical protein VGR72_13230 [Candidatus Acidoferrales bacterium]|nr:hypothetical protein [Candidatus Acidoferrales bacterium]
MKTNFAAARCLRHLKPAYLSPEINRIVMMKSILSSWDESAFQAIADQSSIQIKFRLCSFALAECLAN